MDPAARRNMWRDRIERCLASGMPKGRWCELNKVCKSSFYKWAARFRAEEPGLFAANAQEWFELSREGIRRQVALAPAARREVAPSSTERPYDSRVVAPLDGAGDPSAPMLRALVNGIEFAIPSGCAQSDLETAFRAARS